MSYVLFTDSDSVSVCPSVLETDNIAQRKRRNGFLLIAGREDNTELSALCLVVYWQTVCRQMYWFLYWSAVHNISSSRRYRLSLSSIDLSRFPLRRQSCVHCESSPGSFDDCRTALMNWSMCIYVRCLTWLAAKRDQWRNKWLNYSLNGSSDSVSGDLQFLCRQISTPTKSIPLNRSTKNRQKITSAGGTSYTKIGRNLFIRGFWANGWNITKIIFILFIPFFLWSAYTGQTRGWIFMRDSSKDVKSCKDVPFGVIKLKFNFEHLFIPQNRQILVQNGFFETEDA